MIKSVIRENISIKNSKKKPLKENFNVSDIQSLNSNKLLQNSLRALFLKFKTQKTSPKRKTHLTIKNDSTNKEKNNNNNKKNQINLINTKGKDKDALKKDPGSGIIKNRLKILKNSSDENNKMIYFRNHLNQNSKYIPKSLESNVSKKLRNKINEEINRNNNNNNNLYNPKFPKFKSNNIINIKRNNKKSEEKIKKRNKKIISTHDIYYRNFNHMNNNTLKDYFSNINTSDLSHNNFISRTNNYSNNCDSTSSNHLMTIQNREDNPYIPKKINDSAINNNCYKKINNQTTPHTLNISRKFSGKRNLSNNHSFKFNKNIKEEIKFSSVLNNNSNIQNKTQNPKSQNIVNKNCKYIKSGIKNKMNQFQNKINNEIKVSKQNKKKRKIIIIGKNTIKNDMYKYCNTNTSINNSIHENELISALLLNRIEKNTSNPNTIIKYSTENKRPNINNRIIRNDKIQPSNIINIINNNFNIIKKVSKPNTKSKNSINNSIQNNKIIINNKKAFLNTIEKQKSLQKFQIKKPLIKKLINEKNSKINSIRNNNVFVNKINSNNKKSSEKKMINILPNIKKVKKNNKYTLENNSRTKTPMVNLNNKSCINNIKQNNINIEEYGMYHNMEIDIESSNKENLCDIQANNSVEYNNIQKELKNNKKIKEDEINNKNNKHIEYLEESKKLAEYIKNYFNINNDYPPSNISFYKFGRVIGKGAFGKVNIGLHILTGRIVAIKSFNKTKFTDQKSKNKIMNEIEIMKNLKHFSVVKLLDTIETEKYILLVMENVLGGDLLTFIKKRNKLPEKTAKFIFKQLLQSLKYIHNKNIVHRDIKLDNILIDLNNNIKLCDFGVGKYISDHHELLYDQCGTPAYIAPEVVAGEGYEGFPVDLWSSGVVLYSLLMGSIPFKAQNINELQGLIMSGNYKKTTGISKNANDLLNKLLEINPKKRINVEEALNHPWFSDNNNDNTDSLFTKAELILLSKNNADYRSCPNEEIIENFTIENLDTNKFNKNKNNKTKSFIFAPFNTSYESDKNDKNEDLNDMKLESGLCIQNNIILFEQDANALNRQYELNNNWEIDHGVIINNINDNENKIDNIPKENNYISNNDNDKINFENNNINKDDYKKNKNEQVIKIEKNDFKVEKINENENDNKINKKMPFTSTRNKNNNENQIIPKSNSMIVDENIIKSMDALGYKKEYIQKCIINNDINYCFATYYLLLNSSKFID